jgi:hypothetical protein
MEQPCLHLLASKWNDFLLAVISGIAVTPVQRDMFAG